MPYIVRDASGKISRASARPIINAEIVPFDYPELVQFLAVNGQDPSTVESAFSELRRTDMDMSRAVEDVVVALLRKNLLKMSDLPKPVQDKMALRVRLRVMIQEAYDQASGQSFNATNNTSVSSVDNPA
ncbi:MAG: hypothetical protein PHX43_04670 [Alphaproteobacteria bacterium]|nr:hypothetical protein [Alphaproteobacteria bacterium]